MKLENTHIEGCILLHFGPHIDNRGLFFETFNKDTFSAMGMPDEFKQDNLSKSCAGVLRGLHIQTNNPQGKLIRCITGTIFDVVVDLRPHSKSFKSHLIIELSDHSNMALYAPPSCAHGFYSLDDSVVYYKCTTLYDKSSDGGIHPLDNELNIKWPGNNFVMSDKDKKLPSMRQWLESRYGR